jgi:hypothetical protein
MLWAALSISDTVSWHMGMTAVHQMSFICSKTLLFEKIKFTNLFSMNCTPVQRYGTGSKNFCVNIVSIILIYFSMKTCMTASVV